MIALKFVEVGGELVGMWHYADVPRSGDVIEIPAPGAPEGSGEGESWWRTVHRVAWGRAKELPPTKSKPSRHHIPSPLPLVAAQVTVVLALPSAEDNWLEDE